jgi:hypothetical protein
MLNKNRLGLTGHLTQRDFDANRARSRAKTSQSNIIDTLQSGNYVPGWEKSAFERVQKLGEGLNLVDAGDVGLTGRSKSKPRAPVGPPPGGGPHGNGGGGYSHPGSAESRASSDPFARGGLAALWQR